MRPGPVVAAVVLALASITQVSPAQADISLGTTGTTTGYAHGFGGCTVEKENQDVPINVLPGQSVTVPNAFSTLIRSGGTPIGYVDSASSTTLSSTLVNGGLSSFNASFSGSVTLKSFESTACAGAAGSTVARGAASLSINSHQPIAGAGWLDVSVASSSVRPASYAIGIYNPANDSFVWAVPFRDVAANDHVRVFLPAGHRVTFDFSAGAGINLLTAPTSVSASVSGSLSATVTPVGTAVTPVSGPPKARSSVALPAAVSCTGWARVKVAKYAKKNARSVAFLVNGRTVRNIKRIPRARYYNIRVPQSGGITVRAKVTLKSGKKVNVSRSYAACS